MTPFALSMPAARAGETIVGTAPAGVIAVELIRIEVTPVGRAVTVVSRDQPAGVFSLPVPADAPPTVVGRRAELRYAVRAGKVELPLVICL